MVVPEYSAVILTEDLKETDIQKGKVGMAEFSNFALTFDPRLDPPSEEELLQIGERDPKESHTLRSLRARLYNWQRILNNQGYDSAPSDFYEKVMEVIRWIIAKLP